YHLIHHWANHRYGVFPEHAFAPDKEVYCSRGKEYECNITFHQGDGTAKTSIMFLPYITGVSQFCDNDTHNSEALNMQNERHFRLSTWDVIMQHDDFLRVSTLPVTRAIRTTFREVQQAEKKGRRIVFVLDASVSMRDHNRIGFLRHSFGHLIRHVINDGEMVGIVRFYNQCDVLQPLKEVTDKATREAFAEKVERFSLEFYTAIGCGLELGIKVLESNGTLASGGTLILISDGIENGSPLIADVFPTVLAKGVIVHTFAIGPTADAKLQNVALQTGGTAYFFADNQKNIIASMGISFVLSTTSLLEDSQKPVFKHPVNEKDAGDALTVPVISQRRRMEPRSPAWKPSALVTEPSMKEREKQRQETETWTVVLEKKSEPVKNLSVVVMTKQRGPEDAIRTESCIRHVESTNMIVIYSRVTKGRARVLKANVTATVTLPEKDETEPPLVTWKARAPPPRVAGAAKPCRRRTLSIVRRRFNAFLHAAVAAAAQVRVLRSAAAVI
ncbi:hypothetical protein HPB47_024257, partial [Ixodes persulcatus]